MVLIVNNQSGIMRCLQVIALLLSPFISSIVQEYLELNHFDHKKYQASLTTYLRTNSNSLEKFESTEKINREQRFQSLLKNQSNLSVVFTTRSDCVRCHSQIESLIVDLNQKKIHSVYPFVIFVDKNQWILKYGQVSQFNDVIVLVKGKVIEYKLPLISDYLSRWIERLSRIFLKRQILKVFQQFRLNNAPDAYALVFASAASMEKEQAQAIERLSQQLAGDVDIWAITSSEEETLFEEIMETKFNPALVYLSMGNKLIKSFSKEQFLSLQKPEDVLDGFQFAVKKLVKSDVESAKDQIYHKFLLMDNTLEPSIFFLKAYSKLSTLLPELNSKGIHVYFSDVVLNPSKAFLLNISELETKSTVPDLLSVLPVLSKLDFDLKSRNQKFYILPKIFTSDDLRAFFDDSLSLRPSVFARKYYESRLAQLVSKFKYLEFSKNDGSSDDRMTNAVYVFVNENRLSEKILMHLLRKFSTVVKSVNRLFPHRKIKVIIQQETDNTISSDSTGLRVHILGTYAQIQRELDPEKFKKIEIGKLVGICILNFKLPFGFYKSRLEVERMFARRS